MTYRYQQNSRIGFYISTDRRRKIRLNTRRQALSVGNFETIQGFSIYRYEDFYGAEGRITIEHRDMTLNFYPQFVRDVDKYPIIMQTSTIFPSGESAEAHFREEKGRYSCLGDLNEAGATQQQFLFKEAMKYMKTKDRKNFRWYFQRELNEMHIDFLTKLNINLDNWQTELVKHGIVEWSQI